MDVVCDFCGNEIDSYVKHRWYTGGLHDIVSKIPFTQTFVCKYCNGSFCENHRLPENHFCIKLKDWGKWGAYTHPSVYKTPLFSTNKSLTVKGESSNKLIHYFLISVVAIAVILLIILFFE